MFFGSRFGDRFWEPFGRVLEVNLEPKTGQNEVWKGTEKKTNFEDDFGGQRVGPEHPRNLQDRVRWRELPGPWFLFSQTSRASGS